jgi:predicted house-cleaning noncanonical NTP pyrophosphatase (MazG superfamily)
MKRVRDRIPELVASNGQERTWHRAQPAEYSCRLRDKLLEEAREAASAAEPADPLEDLGDVLQVLYALAACAGLAAAEIEAARPQGPHHGVKTGRLVWHQPTGL